MEAVPRLHMLWFPYKSSPEGTSFANLKKYIAEFYQEDPEAYSKEVFALETLRNQALHTTKDACGILKRYYCQLHSLQNRFPQLAERGIFTFTWKDLYHNNVHEYTDMRYEQAAVLFNIAAAHTQVGASVTRGDVEGMKMACTHFQCAAWAFGELRERYANVAGGGDMLTTELLLFMQQVSFAQAQECILEKSLIDNRKPNIVAKVTAQIVVYYGAALAALLTGGDDGPLAQVIDSSVYKLWKKYVRFKISYLNCILYLYQGQHAEEQRKMGERVTLYEAAWSKLEEARKESKGLPDQKEINESLTFTADVVEGKRKNAKNENEFIYHESIPELNIISAVQGANLVNGISFSVTDPEVAGEDIFARLVPMKAHEASSLYSEEKAKLLRKYGARIEEKDGELASFMSSLTLDNLNINEEKANKIPQGIVDRCAALNANKNAIPDLIAAMSQLAEICADVETNLNEIAAILTAEEQQEREFQQISGVRRTPNTHITELTREFQKYKEAHIRAGESNDTLRKAMELHVNNLKILARPLQEIQQSVPKLSSELNTAEIFKDVKLIVNKVNEMKAQRSQFHADLRIAVNDDDITSKVIAHGTDEGLQHLFDRELAKHERLTQLIDQNLLAQQNILQALTESYAKAAPVLKTLADVKHKRESFFSSLAASYDVYEDLLSKSSKGLEFYKKLSSNVQKLLTRLKSARDVQSEERQQRLKSCSNNAAQLASEKFTPTNITTSNTSTGAPKLRDYLKAKGASNGSSKAPLMPANTPAVTSTTVTQHLPPVRPNPLGSENPTQAVCSGGSYYAPMAPSVAPNEPPPPYSLQQTQFYDPNAAGYTNPIYLQYQQNVAPPAYKPQASPNSQCNTLNANMATLTLQQNGSNMGGPSQSYGSGTYAPLAANMPQVSGNFNYGTSGAYAQAANAYVPTLAATVSSATSIPYSIQSTAGSASQVYTQPVVTTSSNMLPNNQYSYGTGTAVPPASAYASYQQTYQPNQAPSAFPTSVAPVATVTSAVTQPLYVATSQPQPHQQVPATLQPSYVVNTAQPQQQVQPPVQYPNQTPYNAGSVSNATLTGTVTTTSATYTPYVSMANNPGYSYNPQTGNYSYGNGTNLTGTTNTQLFGQYTSGTTQEKSNVGTTDSEIAGKMNLATGFDTPIISHTKAAVIGAITKAPEAKPDPGINSLNYYTPPYGYHTSGAPPIIATTTTTTTATASLPQLQPNSLQQQQQQPQPQPQPQPEAIIQQSVSIVPQQLQPQTQTLFQQPTTYIQSGSASIANTQTTKSAVTYASSTQQAPTVPVAKTSASQTPTATKPTTVRQSSNVDLLTDIDFSGCGAGVPPPILPEPTIKPEVVASPPASQVAAPTSAKSLDATKRDKQQEIEDYITANTSQSQSSPITATSSNGAVPLQLSSPVDSPAARKSSYDNVSVCSDLSSLDNFDWDSVSMRSEKMRQQQHEKHSNITTNSTFQLKPIDPFADDKVLKYFHKEVERYEKVIESLNVKMLNGHTQLSAKWKELQDLLSKEATTRSTTIARLFPEKNRSLDCLPYDHARVKLEKNTDDYINAAYVKNLGMGCPNFIIAQTPQQNTINDFWSMIWSQKSRTVLSLHTPNEMLDPFWPQNVDNESHYDDFTVKCVKIISLSHCTEYNLKLTMLGSDAILELAVLQIKAWTKGLSTQVLGIARNALQGHQQRCLDFNTPNSPLTINCLTGSERSELMAIAICAIMATQNKRPVLINVVDVWFRICSQRQNGSRDASTLEQSLNIVLNHAHDLLNKRGIMTSYQMKIAPQVTAQEKQEMKDPLNELDALWKLK